MVADRKESCEMGGLIGALAGRLLFHYDNVMNNATLLVECLQMLHRAPATSSQT